MTLLFFLRSPAGNTDTGQSPDGGRYWDYDQFDKKKRKHLKAEQIEDHKIAKYEQKKKSEEELLMMLFMHDFADYDD